MNDKNTAFLSTLHNPSFNFSTITTNTSKPMKITTKMNNYMSARFKEYILLTHHTSFTSQDLFQDVSTSFDFTEGF